MTTARLSEERAEPRASRHDDRKAGTLILIGGALDPKGPAMDVFLEGCHAREGGKIVGFTTASTDPVGSGVAWKDAFAAAGAYHASAFMRSIDTGISPPPRFNAQR